MAVDKHDFNLNFAPHPQAAVALRGLCEIVQAAGAELVGIGCAVEKGFQGGGDKLRAAGVNLHSLAIIESAEPGNIVFREEEA